MTLKHQLRLLRLLKDENSLTGIVCNFQQDASGIKPRETCREAGLKKNNLKQKTALVTLKTKSTSRDSSVYSPK